MEGLSGIRTDISMVMFRLNNYAKQIAEELPENTLRTTLRSGVYSFVLTTVITANPIIGAVAGATAMTASLIHACLTPIFRIIAERNDNPDHLEWYQHLSRVVISLSVASATAALCGYRLDIIASVAINLGMMAVRAILDLHENKHLTCENLNSNSTYIIV